jgi:DNA helicase MCM8
MSKKGAAKRFVAELNRVATQTCTALFAKGQLRTIAQELGLQVGSFDEFLASLNNQGYLLVKGPQTYHLQTSEF